ncbi:Nramp family divalent metal transporter [Rhizobium leucaenae]|uniref:NRAMP (Natural resistance-associated macrophage protein)-like metal ion transporter n=1 Tax=Rhizobium leucaenae TaxID=29450 RepID=A0A7W6ZRJ1_9HYPH|nr:Nramp family divalent metal transporter [Rhizobium leucaenae]MBB4566877.1 NRAMP (natural resistance-associated macrophage protein)-like metal ion transporter [Rhizobium leucaenae]MBB6300685.1 NRAMP (natural resistance-associated macrophage protein)-like metal ion transporter [Rhizobium leucaenae]
MRQQSSQDVRDKENSGLGNALGRGFISGAADDDPSAIGTYASAGARFGLDILWTAPVTLPMMFTIVYLSSKLGQVSGRGLFQAIHDFYPRWLLWLVLTGVVLGNMIEAAADLGGMAASIGIFAPLPTPLLVTITAGVIFALQVFGSYTLIRNIFRWLALTLVAYVAAAFLAKPDLISTLKGTFVVSLEFNKDFLSILVAIIGTTLSAYLYTWQSNEEVEEKIADGQTTLNERKGTSNRELRRSRRDILIGMSFSNMIMYFIILCTGATLHANGQTEIETAAQAAEALKPIAGDAAGYLFAAGVVSVGFLAVPVMTTGAAYDLAQSFGWKGSLHATAREAPIFYVIIAAVTAVAVAMNFLGFNPMKALVWSGIVQGFSTPPLLLLIVLMTNNRKIMGDKVNSRGLNIMAYITTAAIFSASIGLVVSWFL